METRIGYPNRTSSLSDKCSHVGIERGKREGLGSGKGLSGLKKFFFVL
jgi:hypothetical protein